MRIKSMKQFVACLMLFGVGVTPAAQLHATVIDDWQCPLEPAATKGKHPHRRHFDVEKFQHELAKFITAEAGLTEAESRAFFPIFFEMQDRQRSLHRMKARSLKQAAANNTTDSDCKLVLEQVSQFEQKAARIGSEYLERLEKVVGPRKLVKAIVAERKFGRRIFKQMTSKKQ